MQRLRIAVLLLGVLCSTAGSAVAQRACVVYYEFDPPVIALNRAQPVLLRAGTTPGTNWCPAAPQLVLQTSPPITLRDDGTGGDERAGDAVFSSSIGAAVLTTGLRPDDVYRRFVAYLDVLDGGIRTARLNIFAQIADASLPRYSITQQGADVQHTAYPPLIQRIASRFF